MDERKIYINIRIADIPLRMNIASSEEELFRAQTDEGERMLSAFENDLDSMLARDMARDAGGDTE